MMPKSSPGVFELDERKRGPAPILQVDEGHLPELVEEVLDVFGADVRGKVAYVDAAFVAASAPASATTPAASAPAAPAPATAAAAPRHLATLNFSAFEYLDRSRSVRAAESRTTKMAVALSVQTTNKFGANNAETVHV